MLMWMGWCIADMVFFIAFCCSGFSPPRWDLLAVSIACGAMARCQKLEQPHE